MLTFLKKRWLGFGVFALFVATSSVHMVPTAQAAVLTLAPEPMATSNGLSVKPNMLFILDNSGSMLQNYTPDYIDEVAICDSDNNSGVNAKSKCTHGDPPFNAAGFNYQFYDPTIKYDPPKDSNGVDYAASVPTAANIKPFLTSGTGVRTADLTTQNIENYWCKNSSDIPYSGNTTGSNPSCVKHNNGDNYKYPDTTYKYKETNGFWCKNATDVPVNTSGNQNSNCVRAFLTSAGVYDNDTNTWAFSTTYSYFKTSTNTVPYYYNMSGALDWCVYSTSTGAFTNCGPKRTATRKWARFLTVAPAVNGVRATASMTIANVSNTSLTATKSLIVSTVTVNGINLLSSPINITIAKLSTYSGATLATQIVSAINSNSGISGFGAALQSNGSNVIFLTAPYDITSDQNTTYNAKTITTSGTNFTVSAKTAFSGGVNYIPAVTANTFTKVEITPTRTIYPKYEDRLECAASGCTYAQELQNYANWFTYYKTRMEMMKTVVSRVFSQISDTAPGIGFRVGFRVISAASTSEVQISDFTQTQKNNFFTKLFAVNPSGSTPLRGALMAAGRLYGNKYTYDPIQQSCQQNFTFLSTDGYWNDGSESSSYGPYQLASNTAVGNTDGTTSGEALPMLDANNISNSLADVAEYYWKNDLRADLTNNVPTSSRDTANWQHMVTFTLGLGVPGNLEYASNYVSGGSADYNNLVAGVAGYDWGDPINNAAEARIDDLWHAAVNGRGLYFAATNPRNIITSLTTALNSAAAVTGAGAAAATSNLEPVAGDNFAYTASYTTKDWVGNLRAQLIDLTTGVIDGTDTAWDAQPLLDAKATAGTRTLYTIDKTLTTEDKKFAFTWNNMLAKGWDSYFNPNLLSQCTGTLATCSGQTNQNLFQYLIGLAVNPANSYRLRPSVLGDIVNSQPVFVGKAQFGYQDAGYATFVGTQDGRRGQVYVGSNDGFLHAFDAATGDEKWAFTPQITLNKMYKIADNNYSGNHQYFVDGKITVGDIYDGTKWRTILVGGLGAGGAAYYGIDITNPDTPKVLWEFTNAKLGFSFGNPIITKLADGSWVALVTSGYNNGDKGQLFVLNPVTGAVKYTIATAASANDSGLAKMANWVINSSQDNTTQYVYSGDLDGALWKFTLGATSGTVAKFADIGEPMTTKPIVAAVTSGSFTVPVVIQGTGQYLQNSDKGDNTKRSLFALKDDGVLHTAIKGANSASYVEQTLSAVGANNRTATNKAMDWTAKRGWFVTFLDAGERVSIDPKLQLGTLIVPTNVPSLTPTACSAGGYAWNNYFDVLSGSYVKSTSVNPTNAVSTRIGNALVVGINVVRLPNGKLISIITTSDNAHPVVTTPTGGGGGTIKRVSWKEIITE